MADLKQKPNEFEPGARTLSARDLNQIRDAVPRLITGGAGTTVSKFGDRLIVSATEQALAVPPGQFPHGKRWPFGYSFSADGPPGEAVVSVNIHNIVVQLGQGAIMATSVVYGGSALSVPLPDPFPVDTWGGLLSLQIDYALLPDIVRGMQYITTYAFTLVWGERPVGVGVPTTVQVIPLYMFRGRGMVRDFIHGLCFPQVWLPYTVAEEEEPEVGE